MMGKVIVCYCIESEGTDPGRSEVSTGETNEHWYRVPLRYIKSICIRTHHKQRINDAQKLETNGHWYRVPLRGFGA